MKNPEVEKHLGTPQPDLQKVLNPSGSVKLDPSVSAWKLFDTFTQDV